MRNHIPKAILLTLLALLVAGCGEDSPTAPEAPGNTGGKKQYLDVSEYRVNYDLVCVGDTETYEFQIFARETNQVEISGEVSIGENANRFKITQGAGPYTLAPGESQTIKVQFEPTRAGVFEYGFVDFGYDSMQLALEGFGSEEPKVRFTPVALRSWGVVPNTLHFQINEPRLNIPDTGVSYSNPTWESCPGSAWIFNGNSVAESWIDFTFDVPDGTKKVLIELDMDAAGDCAQLLMEIDGDENVRTNFGTSCSTRRYRFDISSGRHTIRIGTDQQSIGCGKDLSVDSITFTFEGRCVPPYEFLPSPY